MRCIPGVFQRELTPWRASAPTLLPASGEGVYDSEALIVRVPTLVFWGLQDHALLPGCIEDLDGFVPDLRLVRFPEGTHWIAHELPDEIAEGVAGFAVQRATKSMTV